MKVLIGVDGSQGGFEAVRQTSKLLAADKDAIALYYAPPRLQFPWGSLPAETGQSLSEQIFEGAKAILPEPFRGKVQEIVGDQDPRHGLLAAADEWQADMIAVGARGTGPIQRLLLGSVSRALVQGAKVPVLVARPRSEHAALALAVLVAYDGSPIQERVAQFLHEPTWPPETDGRLITVMEPLFPGELPSWIRQRPPDPEIEAMAKGWLQEYEQERAKKRQELEAFCSKLPEPFRRSPPIVSEGNPADQILKIATKDKVAIIVMGAQRRGAVERWLLGSTSETVLTHAPCSVLVVREKEPAS